MHEECGVFGVWSPSKLAVPREVYLGLYALQLLHGAENSFFRGGDLQPLRDDRVDDGFRVRRAVEDSAAELVARAQGPGVDQVSVMAEGHVALHMADDDRLDVVVVLAAGGGVTDVADGDVSFAQPVQAFFIKHLAHQAVALIVTEDTVTGDCDAAAFLPPVLQGVEPEIDFPGNRPL